MKNPDIKILRIIARLNIGGPSIHVALLMHGLDSEIFSSRLITGKVPPYEGDMSYLLDDMQDNIILIPELQRNIHSVKDFRSLMAVFRVLKQHRPDIVHTHTAKAGTIGRMAVTLFNIFERKNKIHVFHTFHGHVFRGYFGKLKSQAYVWAERLLAKMTDVIIVISQTQKEELCDRYRIAPENKFRIVQLGFDLSPFLDCKGMKGRFRSQFAINRSSLLIGIIGRLVPIKNHRMFLEAARLFSDRYPHKKAIFMIIGDGEERPALEAYRDRLGLGESLKFCEWKKYLPDVYSDLNIVALTSINEGTPVSLIEAMASGVPVISTDAGGVRDLMGVPMGRCDKGFTLHERGLMCRQNDVEGFVEGLVWLSENDLKTQSMVHRAREHVSRMHRSERLITETSALYLSAVGDKREGHPLSTVDAALRAPRFRVLHVYKDYYPPVFGGMEKHISEMSRGLSSRGIRCRVMVSNTTPRSETYRDNHVTITRVPEFGRIQSAPINPNFCQVLRKMSRQADILHFHFPNPTAELSMVFSRIKKPYVITYHSDIERQKTLRFFYQPFMHRFLRKAQRIIVSSPNYLKTSKVLMNYKEKCVVIPHGIDRPHSMPLFPLRKAVARVKKRFGERLVLFIGRLRYYKGLEYLIQAMQHVDAVLLVIGEGEPVASHVKGLTQKLVLQEKIKFLGTVDDMEKEIFMDACDMLVLPSIYRSEAFGLVLLEAMSHGKPVVSTELGTGTSFVNVHQQTGLVVPPRNPIKLAEAINSILNDSRLKKIFGYNAKKRVERYFLMDRMIEQVIDVYLEILSKHEMH